MPKDTGGTCRSLTSHTIDQQSTCPIDLEATASGRVQVLYSALPIVCRMVSSSNCFTPQLEARHHVWGFGSIARGELGTNLKQDLSSSWVLAGGTLNSKIQSRVMGGVLGHDSTRTAKLPVQRPTPAPWHMVMPKSHTRCIVASFWAVYSTTSR